MAAALSADAGEVVFESKPVRAHLIELYTSEGCSSCPPAEEWMSGLKNQPRLWQDIVPVAFHVDYWDRLGWRDPFASKLWTERQGEYSARWKTESVYTPAFVLDGKEWHYGKLPEAGAETPGVLKVTGERRARQRVLQLVFRFRPSLRHSHRPARLFSEDRRNRGRK
jgi:hypothetical protein